MRRLSQITLLFVALGLLAGCLFKEPIFSSGFIKVDPSLAGIWASEGENGDPRKTEFAALVPIDGDRYLLHHPVGAKDGIYYEARPLQVRGRLLLQLRVLASFNEGMPKPGADSYTLLWVDRGAADAPLHVRSLAGDKIKGKDAAAVRKLIEDPGSDWAQLFGDATAFHRLKDG